jgi:hypothetical protein
MAREFAPLPERLKSATARMEKIPALLAQARENLDPARVPKDACGNRGEAECRHPQPRRHLHHPQPRKLQGRPRAARSRGRGLRKAVAEHQAWLDKTLVPNAKGDFRIGQTLYDQKLQFALLSSLSRADIRQRADGELKRVREEMYGIARTVLKDKPARPSCRMRPAPTAAEGDRSRAGTRLCRRPARDKVVEYAAQPRWRCHRLRARQGPGHPAGRSGEDHLDAGIPARRGGGVLRLARPARQGPGHLLRDLADPGRLEQKQVDSFLREYNNRMIHLLASTKAMPGHYLEGGIRPSIPPPCARCCARACSPKAGRCTPRT